MSSFSTPSTPSRPRNAGNIGRAPSNFSVSFVSIVEDVIIPTRDEQFIEYGSVMLALPVGASIPNDSLDWPRLSHYFRNTELLVVAYLFDRDPRKWIPVKGTVITVSGELSAWGIRTSDAEEPENSMMYDSIMMTTGRVIKSFVGRVRNIPDTPTLSFNDVRPLLERGVFVEVQFFLRRSQSAKDRLLRKGALSFYIFVFFDVSAQRRNDWAFQDDRVNLAAGQMFHCMGSVIGQLKEKFVSRAGYEKETPPRESPILLVVPILNLRPTDHGSTGPSLDSTAVSSPPTQTFHSKLERLRSRNLGGQSSGGTASGSSGMPGSQQWQDLTTSELDINADNAETPINPSLLKSKDPPTTPTQPDSPSAQLRMNRDEPSTGHSTSNTDEVNSDTTCTIIELQGNEKGGPRKRKRCIP
ncbi:hypothetical protein F4804DRAFT_336973 [Jackrogersella minutella]|nr:hypothetical protein F4804DRAFT_336973 [Jackrogersella minutella]